MYFKLRDKKEVSSVLLVHQCYDKRMVLSVGVKVKASNWDSETQRSKGRKSEDRSLNAQLDHIKAAANEALIRFRLDSINPSADELKEAVQVTLGSLTVKEETALTILQLIELYRPHSPKSSFRIIRSSIATLKDFLAMNKPPLADFPVSQINLEWLDRFWLYVVEEKQLAHNTSVAIFGVLRRALRHGLRYRLHENAMFLEFKIAQKKTDSVYLNEEEVDRLYNIEPTSETMRFAVDMFVLQCETGLRYSDLSQLKSYNFTESKSKIGDSIKVLTKKTQKTKETVTIPLSSLALEIVSRYDFDEISVPSLPHYVVLLQRACKIAGLDEVLTMQHRGKIVTKPKYSFVTSHTARRSFATNAYLAGVPTGLIMKLTGHNSESSFMRYIKATSLESAIRVADHEYFKRKREDKR